MELSCCWRVGRGRPVRRSRRLRPSAERLQFVFNSFSFLIHGVLVMFMAAGFAMLESGLVRSKNTAAICLKNIALYSIAGLIAFYLIGYNLMYVGVRPKVASSGKILVCSTTPARPSWR